MPYANPNAPAAPVTSVTPTVPGGGDYLDYFLNNTPEAGFWYYLNQNGLVGNTPSQKYAQGRYGNVYGQYQASAADNPNEGFYDFLKRKQPSFDQEFKAQSPEQRGDFTDRSLTPRGRFTRAY